MPEEPITIGKIIGAHGLKGVVKVQPLTSFPDRFEPFKKVILESATGQRGSFVIEGLHVQKDCLLVKFQGLSALAEVTPFMHGTVQVPREELVRLPEGSYYHFDLLGMRVITDEGRCLGTLEEILPTGSNDVYVVRSGDREYLIPGIRDVVREVRVDQKTMTIHVLEGLLEHDSV